MRTLCLWSAALLLLFPALAISQTADNVLVLVNENSEDSRAIARYYAEKRKIPAANICRIRTTESETIPRAAFEQEILRPAAAYLKSKFLQDQILYIVTTRGLPVAIEGNEGPLGDMTSVDSELALLYRVMVTEVYSFRGKVENPYFALDISREGYRPFTRRDYDIYLVTRLSGTSVADAVLLVDRAGASASGGAFYFDLASAQQSTEADWLQQTASILNKAGLKATLDNTGKVLENLTAVQGYANQGSNDINLKGRIPAIQWNPGAIATVLDKITARSFQAIGSENDALSASSTAARFVQSGVTGFGGYVADPTVDGYVRPQILFPAYTGGYNLAESYYAATRYLSWRQLILGDPLAAPYAKNAPRARDPQLFRGALDKETGLPEQFAERRELFLIQRYSTSRDAVLQLLRAEAAAAGGDNAKALSLADASLAQDPLIAESHLLKARLLETARDFARSFEQYEAAVKQGKTGHEMYRKLARMAIDELKNPKKAAPYTQWLYRQYGRKDLEITRTYAAVELQNGRTDEARAVYNRLVTEINPAPPFALAGLGRIYFDQGNFELAKDFLTRALERSAEAAKKSPSQPDQAQSVDEADMRKLLDQAIAKLPAQKKDDPAVSVSLAPAEAISAGTQPARVVTKTPIEYPTQARSGRVEGAVVVSLLIDEMGQVMKGNIMHGPKVLGEAVLKSAMRWRFEPQLENGRAVTSRYTLTISFKINPPR